MAERSVWREIAVILAQTTLSWFVIVATLGATASLGGGQYDGFLGVLIGPILLNGIVLVVGLPLRLFPRAHRFVRRHGELAVGLAIVGVGVTVLGYALTQWWALLGLLVIAFGVVHAWPPFAWLWDDEAQVERRVARGRALGENTHP